MGYSTQPAQAQPHYRLSLPPQLPSRRAKLSITFGCQTGEFHHHLHLRLPGWNTGRHCCRLHVQSGRWLYCDGGHAKGHAERVILKNKSPD